MTLRTYLNKLAREAVRAESLRQSDARSFMDEAHGALKAHEIAVGRDRAEGMKQFFHRRLVHYRTNGQKDR